MARWLPLWVVIVGACGDELVRWRDPPVSLDDDAVTHGLTTLVIGFGQGEAFVSLSDVPVQLVVRGLQGGTWTMPTLRADSLAATLAVECRLATATGEALGETSVTTPTRPAAPGWVEVGLLPIPVTHAPPRSGEPIADLEGSAATLSCAASSAGTRVTTEYAVTLDVP